jgi:hypothetical protein
VEVRRLLAAVSFAALLASAAAQGQTPAPRSLAPFAGLGAWVSIYDGKAWANPEGTIANLASHDVQTLFLETANYRQRVDLVRPQTIARFLAAAHATDMQVVAWYLPSLAKPAVDLRRSLAPIRLVTADGDRFDGFALDVEATTVRSLPLRNRRATSLVQSVRRAAPHTLPLGAIVIGPIGNSPTYWPSFPYRSISKFVDVLLPMAYFTARARGAAGVNRYVVATMRYLRAQTTPTFPIHVVGGLTTKAKAAEVQAFATATSACGAIGGSLWEYGTQTLSQWQTVAAFGALTAPGGAPC